MSELASLYQEVILDHNRKPRNLRSMEAATHQAQGYNPLCGDKVRLFVKMDGDRISDASFQGSGCAISTASVSILTEAVKGRTRAEVEALFDRFHDLVTGKIPASEAGAGLGKLAVFSGVSEFPVRVKCASLAWHTLKSALGGGQEVVSTESPDDAPGGD
jgi:nitrogen fixation NifU-like protein